MRSAGAQSRSELLERVSGARSQQAISDAGLEARRYLAEYPGDADVIAANEKLHRRGIKLADPEGEASPGEIATYMGAGLMLVFLPAAAMLLFFGRSLQEAVIVGAGLGALVFWDMTLAVATGWQSFGKKAFRVLKNRGGSR